jgi:hypothetical protein
MLTGMAVAIVILSITLLYVKATRIRVCEANARFIQNCFCLLMGDDGKPVYKYKGARLDWGKDMTPDQVRRIKEEHEIMLLYDAENKPLYYILADSYNQFRQMEYAQGSQWVKCG